jgi:hypothetical protein
VIFNRHFNLEGLHAPFSASKPSWLNYDDDKAVDVYLSKKASELGTKYHQWAKDTIDLKIKQPRSNKTLSAYVNDAIGYKMSTEVVLYYSDNFFGTADAISFNKGVLRIHDLKTGKIPAKMEQLLIYTALFCLEYKIKPSEIEVELRIYQNDEILYHKPEADEIVPIMDHIVHLDKIITRARLEEV